MTEEQKAVVDKAISYKENGWTYIRVEGKPYDCGFQEGYLLVDEYKDAMRVYGYMTLQTYGMTYEWFKEQSVRLHKDMIPESLKEEMTGMADGLTAAGYPTDFDDILAWNDWMEVTQYWWPLNASKVLSGRTPRIHRKAMGSCSSIVAGGSAVKGGKVVLAHESFDEFWSGQYFNVCKSVNPESGNAFIMQAFGPCSICSLTDFYVTSAGLAVSETTLAGFEGYDDDGMPEWVRIRNAVQQTSNIDDFVKVLNDKNNGGYANAWLIADNNTGEIARYEQGLLYQSLEKKTDGCFFGCNAVFDPRIRNLECKDNCFNDPRQQEGARRQRWDELIKMYEGEIDVEIAKKMLADTFDVYLGYDNPSSRGICSHYDVDPQYYADDPNAVWNVPFYPAGSCDGKATDSSMIESMQMWGRYGRADGIEFDVDAFFRQHPLWDWMKGYLYSRPSEPWTLFNANGEH